MLVQTMSYRQGSGKDFAVGQRQRLPVLVFLLLQKLGRVRLDAPYKTCFSLYYPLGQFFGKSLHCRIGMLQQIVTIISNKVGMRWNTIPF